MLWVVQNNLYKETGYENFIASLLKLDQDYMIVKPVPFTNILLRGSFDSMVDEVDSEPELQFPEGLKIAMGSTTLCRIAYNLGWEPGSFTNENFTYQRWVDGFGSNNLLNPDSIVGTAKSSWDISDDHVFVRPVKDDKAFSGTVMSRDDFFSWLETVQSIDLSDQHILGSSMSQPWQPLHIDTEFTVASTKEILREYRLFVVDGKIVTGSQYKLGDRVMYSPLVDDDVISFANTCIKNWEPAQAFVLDIAQVPNGYKIIEVNNLNSSGFYDADTDKLVDALSNMKFG